MSGNKDFTVDLWYYRVGPATGQIVGMRTSQTQYCSWIIYDNIAAGNITIFLSSTGSDWAIAQNTPVGAVGSGVWTHLALVRSATLGKISFFINGAQTYSVSLASTVWLAGVQNSLGIGGNSEATSGVSAYIDELRFSDVARWTGTSFTPPAAPYA
jgi:hypothetical protein